MSIPAIIPGTIQADGKLKLDYVPNLPPGPVVVTVQSAPVAAPIQGGLADIIDEIRTAQQARGFKGRSAEEIEAVRQEGEAEYEQRRCTFETQANAGSSAGDS